MWFKKIIILFFVLISICTVVSAQETPVKTDSTHIYENIESYSKQSKFTMFIYRLIFKPVAPALRKKEAKNKGYKKLIQKPYRRF